MLQTRNLTLIVLALATIAVVVRFGLGRLASPAICAARVAQARVEATPSARADIESFVDPDEDQRLVLEPLERPSAEGAPGASRGADATTGGEEDPESVEAEEPVVTLAELQEFRAYVAGTLAELRRERAAELLQAIERRSERIDATVSALETRLELTPAQSKRLKPLLLVQLEREAEYVRLWEAGSEDSALDALKAKDRHAHLAELRAFLTAKQVREL